MVGELARAFERQRKVLVDAFPQVDSWGFMRSSASTAVATTSELGGEEPLRWPWILAAVVGSGAAWMLGGLWVALAHLASSHSSLSDGANAHASFGYERRTKTSPVGLPKRRVRRSSSSNIACATRRQRNGRK